MTLYDVPVHEPQTQVEPSCCRPSCFDWLCRGHSSATMKSPAKLALQQKYGKQMVALSIARADETAFCAIWV